ncbi:hypothetical protein [Pseudorhodobacter turbinis]|uniref:hypothetical protein n=1 Tax=Pseudorhodobacter turbinis TaxID=2500533 RepID=UPI00143DAD63|nr:hypothetical protein [Pseudorhodobacter turbinis]
MQQIINIVINQIIRRFVKVGINKAVNHFASTGSTSKPVQGDLAKRARQSAKITRRLGR